MSHLSCPGLKTLIALVCLKTDPFRGLAGFLSEEQELAIPSVRHFLQHCSAVWRASISFWLSLNPILTNATLLSLSTIRVSLFGSPPEVFH